MFLKSLYNCIHYRIPGEPPKTFLADENGAQRMYLCKFEEIEPSVIAGRTLRYTSSQISLPRERIDIESTGFNTYSQQFDTYMSAFKGGLEKAILSRVINIEHNYSSCESIFEKLCETYPDAFVYVGFLGSQCWAGASPETLLTYKGGEGHTVALAGTVLNREEWTEKEHREQQVVVEYIRSLDSEKHSLLSESDGDWIRAGKLFHKINHFKFSFEKDEIIPFLKKLHPTPAVCGLPKEESMALIRGCEKHSRAFYAGYIGFQDDLSFKAFVNLRCMQLSKKNAILYVGGGLNTQSDVQKEWDETQNKANTLLEIFA